jgi:hypothetical protein
MRSVWSPNYKAYNKSNPFTDIKPSAKNKTIAPIANTANTTSNCSQAEASRSSSTFGLTKTMSSKSLTVLLENKRKPSTITTTLVSIDSKSDGKQKASDYDDDYYNNNDGDSSGLVSNKENIVKRKYATMASFDSENKNERALEAPVESSDSNDCVRQHIGQREKRYKTSSFDIDDILDQYSQNNNNKCELQEIVANPITSSYFSSSSSAASSCTSSYSSSASSVTKSFALSRFAINGAEQASPIISRVI